MLGNVCPGLPASWKIFLDLTECVQRSVNACPAEPCVGSGYSWMRPLLAGGELARVGREPPRAGEFGGSEGVRNRESGRFSGAGGRLSWGRVRGGERRGDVAKRRGKGRGMDGRREFALSASGVNCWGGGSAPDRQAPRTGHSSVRLVM